MTDSRAQKWIRRGGTSFVAGLLLFAFAKWKSVRLPTDVTFQAASRFEPNQSEARIPPFTVEKAGHTYDIEPVHRYVLRGLIVTNHASDSFFDISHAEWGDSLNTMDICVVWGENLDTELLQQLEFSSGDWTCYVQTQSTEAWERFQKDQLSNNHLLPASPQIAAALSEAEIGDEIIIEGHLVNYGIDGQPPRKTSTTRLDSGNGACEVVYVDNYRTLARHNKKWINLRKVALGISIAGLAFLIFGAFVLPFLGPSFSRSSNF